MKMDFGKTFLRAVGLCRKNFAKIFYLFFPVAILVVLSNSLPDQSVGSAIVSGLFEILVSLVALIAYWSILYVFSDNLKPADAVKRSLKNFGPLATILLLAGLIKLGGVLALLVPGIIFSIWFIFSELVFITENKKGWSALLRSREYVKGYEWIIFGNVIFLGIVSMVVSFVAGFSGQIAPALWFIWSLAANLLIGPFIAAFIFSLFKEVSANKSELKDKPVSGKKTVFIVFAALPLVVAVILAILGTSGLLNIFK